MSLALVSTLALSIVAASPTPGDLVIENARIWSDGRVVPAAFAVVKDGVFTYVGDRDDRYIGRDTQRLDVGGRFVLPGLTDSHIELLAGARRRQGLDLTEARSREDFVRRVAAYVASLPDDDGWILGGGWSTRLWETPVEPTKYWFDELTGDRPMFLLSRDGHRAIANSAALRAAGLTPDVPDDPPGGFIDRNSENGDAAGLLIEAAVDLVRRAIPRDIEADAAAIRAAAMEAASFGLTTLVDFPRIEDLPVYEHLLEGPTLPVRLVLYPTSDDWTRDAPRLAAFASVPNRIEIRGVHTLVDGSFESRAALMDKPYDADPRFGPGRIGLLREHASSERLVEECRVALAEAWPIALSVHGNAAMTRTLAMLDRGGATRASRVRIEHAEMMLRSDITLSGATGLVMCLLPAQKGHVGRYAEDLVGERRSHWSYPARSLLDAGAVVVFGSGWPANPLSPFVAMETASSGRREDGRYWRTHENLTIAEIFRGYTSRAAFGIGAEAACGRIAPGFRADFTVLNESPFNGGPDWMNMRSDRTYRDGRLVFNRAAAVISEDSR